MTVRLLSCHFFRPGCLPLSHLVKLFGSWPLGVRLGVGLPFAAFGPDWPGPDCPDPQNPGYLAFQLFLVWKETLIGHLIQQTNSPPVCHPSLWGAGVTERWAHAERGPDRPRALRSPMSVSPWPPTPPTASSAQPVLSVPSGRHCVSSRDPACVCTLHVFPFCFSVEDRASPRSITCSGSGFALVGLSAPPSL